jgi:plastocyanin
VKHLLLLAPLALLVASPPASGSRQPARVQVLAREFNFTLSRNGVRKGDVTFELANFGADPHNLVVKRLKDGAILDSTGDVLGGSRAELTLKLRPGKYELYCSVANHESLGMQALLKVKAPVSSSP